MFRKIGEDIAVFKVMDEGVLPYKEMSPKEFNLFREVSRLPTS